MPASTKDFRVLAVLGKGSYGTVSKVERLADGVCYALKEVNIKRLSPREREDAVNEIRILASIKHRNIVRYCDAFVERDNLYIVMEFAEGGDIGRQVEKFKKANKYIKEDHIWSYIIQLCRALNELHSRNVLHRDIKPKNVFLTGKNHIRLGDLGCAKLMKTGLARTQIGTPYYMSPEIWCNRPYDQKSDMWAVGCLLYELTMLMPPFLANDMNALALKVKTTPAPRISKHYSDDLANLVAALLSKDPKARLDAKSILMSPVVMSKLHLVPEDDESPWAGEDLRSAMLATIRVPTTFGYGVKPMLALPGPAYPVLKRADSAPAGDLAAAAAGAGAGAGAAAAGGAGSEAADADAGRAAMPTAAPAPFAMPVAVSAAARAAFAAATSPPQLGRYVRREPSGLGPGADGKENIPLMAPLGIAEKAAVGLARAPSAPSLAPSAPLAPPAAPKPLVSVPSARNLSAPTSALTPSYAPMRPGVAGGIAAPVIASHASRPTGAAMAAAAAGAMAGALGGGVAAGGRYVPSAAAAAYKAGLPAAPPASAMLLAKAGLAAGGGAPRLSAVPPSYGMRPSTGAVGGGLAAPPLAGYGGVAARYGVPAGIAGGVRVGYAAGGGRPA